MKTLTDKVPFKFRDLEITQDALVLHFYDDKTVIPLNEIQSYRLDWHLHEPVFAKKWWFLVLTIELDNGSEECGPVAFVKFNYLDQSRQAQWHIERIIADALDVAVARTAAPAQKMICI